MMTAAKHLLRFFGISEGVLVLLAALSIFLLYIPESWLTYSVEFDPSQFPARLTTDSQGVTQAEWINRDKLKWRCDLDPEFRHAFCSMILTLLDDAWQGIDMRKFTRMAIEADYGGDGETMRLYLRNRHPDYYIIGDELSTKYNLVEIPVSYMESAHMFDMSSFVVAEWWRVRRNLALRHANPEFGNIMFLELQTGSFRNDGFDEVELKGIRFERRLLSDELLYRGLAALWIVVILILLLIKLKRMKRDLKVYKQYQRQLKSINKLLNLQNRKFEDLAKTDHLTGALNRMGMRDILLSALKQRRESQNALSLIFIDLDYFKQVNDTYGHDIGDETLAAVVELINSNTDSDCTLSRWGGEEFLLACVGKSLEEARRIAEHLCGTLESTRLYSGVTVTASFGVATLNGGGLNEAIKHADAALYEAKTRGRNCVVVASQEEEKRQKPASVSMETG